MSILDTTLHRRRSAILCALVSAIGLAWSGCNRSESIPGASDLDQARCGFDVYWPPKDPEKARPNSARPLLKGSLELTTEAESDGAGELRLVVTLRRPSEESDREFWNSRLAYAHLDWMKEVRVWDRQRKWLWPNLPYLLRLPGQERVERYGGVDPGKGVDNDFAAVLIRKYDAAGKVESDETKQSPLVSAEWHPVDVANPDQYAIVHAARSDAFVLHLGQNAESARGRIKVWLIYADFLGEPSPPGWPKTEEFAGGILAFFEIDWETSPGRPCRGVVRNKRPESGAGFDWTQWVERAADADRSEAKARLSDQEPARS